MRQRLLFLSQTLPYPPDSGVKIRTFHTMRILSHAYDVTALCFFRRRQTGSDGPGKSSRSLSGMADVQAFPIPQEWSRLRWVKDHVASLVGGHAYVEEVFRSGDFSTRLSELLRDGDFNLVHFESSSLARYMDRASGVPRVCVHHNVESRLLERRAEVAANPLVASYLRLQAGRLRELEAAVCPRMDLNVAVSHDDRKEFERIAPGARFCTIPNGVDTESFAPLGGSTEGVALLGGTDWFPNLDALEYFAAEILPLVRQDHPEVRVICVGRADKAEIERFRRDFAIEVTGYVDDIRPYIHRARCVAVPLRVGGGSRLKILDSWAMGKAVVTTTIGCEGLAARSGENALVEDEPVEFARAISDLLSDERRAAALGQAGRQVAVETYSWDAIEPAMLAAYESIIPRSREHSPGG